MKKKLISFSLFIGLVLSYSFVFSDKDSTNLKIKSGFRNGNTIYLDSSKLNSLIISYISNIDLTTYEVESTCVIKSTFLKKINNEYFFKVKYLNSICSNPNIVLKDINGNINSDSLLTLKLIDYRYIINVLIDYSDKDLENMYSKLENSRNRYFLFSTYIKGVSEKSFSFLTKNRKYKELSYNLNIINSIIKNREKKYISPVLKYKISNKYSKLPNAGRPYRQSYTDGIHHGWDVDAPYGTKVIALDKAIVVRVVNNFSDNDSHKIKKGKGLSYIDKLKNLDILRGNQVWIKTMKGDVIFYSHLSKIYPNIKPGIILKKGAFIGEIGISGIPGTNYTDYHLHFAIQKNPYIKSKYGKYSYNDYMSWDWKFKGKSREYILKNTSEVFQ